MHTVDIALDAPLPEEVGGKARRRSLRRAPYTRHTNSSISLFRIVADGTEAVRANVKFGQASVQTIEVLEGLKAGDQIILSDMSNWDTVDPIRLKP
jgi:multidrug efflux pump subunit AcrA (membrane-fusion protein)